MQIKVLYKNGMIETHSTSDYQVQNPFDHRSMITTFRLATDNLADGLWLRVYYHDIDQMMRDSEHLARIATPRLAVEFTLIPPENIDNIVRLTQDDTLIATRIGEHLVNVVKFESLANFYLGRMDAPNALMAYQLYMKLAENKGLDTADPNTLFDLAEEMGWPAEALQEAVEIGAEMQAEIDAQEQGLEAAWGEGQDSFDSELGEF